ncbi:MAG: ABC transporter substrate-binding protein [Candidatus Lustribacter sp.]|jgi:NitT/TauT family transport system substrate-binding protein
MTDGSRKAFLGGTAAALAVAGTAPVQAQVPLPKLRIGSGPADAYAEGWYGVDEGFFKNAGLDVEYLPFNSGSLATAAVLGGSCDIVCGTTMTLAIAVAKGVPLGIVAPAAVNTASGPQALLCVRKDGPIHTAADMVGKTIGVNVLGTSVDLAIEAWFAKNGLDPKSAKFVEVLAAEVGTAIDRGTIDAFAQGEPALSDALHRNDVRVLVDPMPAIAPRFLYAAWYATPQWFKANLDTARRFQNAIAVAARWGNANHAASAVIVAKYTKLPVAAITTMMRADFSDGIHTEEIQPLLDTATKFGFLPRPMTTAELVLKA